MTKYEMWLSQDKKCAHCGKNIEETELCDQAHILPQREWIKKKYGEEIVHHYLNMKVTCHNDNCNSGVQMSPNKTKLVKKHAAMIQRVIDKEMTNG